MDCSTLLPQRAGSNSECTLSCAEQERRLRWYHHIEMRPETFGRVLGIGLRVAGRVAGQRIGAASQSSASSVASSAASSAAQSVVVRGAPTSPPAPARDEQQRARGSDRSRAGRIHQAVYACWRHSVARGDGRLLLPAGAGVCADGMAHAFELCPWARPSDLYCVGARGDPVFIWERVRSGGRG